MSPRYPGGPRGPGVRMPDQVSFNVSHREVYINKNVEHKNVNIILSVSVNTCFGCSK